MSTQSDTASTLHGWVAQQLQPERGVPSAEAVGMLEAQLAALQASALEDLEIIERVKARIQRSEDDAAAVERKIAKYEAGMGEE